MKEIIKEVIREYVRITRLYFVPIVTVLLAFVGCWAVVYMIGKQVFKFFGIS